MRNEDTEDLVLYCLTGFVKLDSWSSLALRFLSTNDGIEVAPC